VGRGERQCSPPHPENTVDAKWSTRLTPLEPYLRIGLSGHGLPRLANPALFKEGLGEAIFGLNQKKTVFIFIIVIILIGRFIPWPYYRDK
jgi:hypothetical protein